MSVYITPHSVSARHWARLSNGQTVGAIGGQGSPGVRIAIAEEENHTAPAAAAGLYRIVVSGADCMIKIGQDAVADADAELWLDGDKEYRWLHQGERISVIARPAD